MHFRVVIIKPFAPFHLAVLVWDCTFARYKLAARKFVEVHTELGSNYRDVISPQDVAIYGGLCALASFDRAELKAKVRSS